MARIPVVERAVGQDRLAHWHRWTGFTSFTLMLAHIGLITWGYAAGRPRRRPGDVLGPHDHLPGHAARAGRDAVPGHGRRHQHPGGPQSAALRVVAPAAPLRLPRRRPRAAAPAVDRPGVPRPRPPPPSTGGRSWAAAAAAVLVWRVGLPLYRSLRHDLRITSVVPESRGRRLGPPRRPRPAPAARDRRPVPDLALPDRPRLDPRAPLLAVRRAGRAQPADHRQDSRRRQRPRAQPASRRPRPDRGPLRPAHRAPPDPERRSPSSARGSASRRCARSPRRCPTPPATRCCCSARPVRPLFARELDAARPRARAARAVAARAAPCARLLARRGRRPGERPDPAAPAGSPTSPNATSTCAARRTGPTPSARTLAAAGLPAAQLHVENFGW